MTITISPPRNTKVLAAFLEKMNSEPTKHVGYCGENKGEIYHTLCHDFSDLDLSQSFAVAYEEDRIVGALGLDIDEDDLSAEVWGPFISEEIEDVRIADRLWKEVISYSAIQLNKMVFFLNKKNKNAREFVLRLGGVETGNHSVLIANHDEFGESKENEIEIESYSPLYAEAFLALHEAEFPNTYYDVEEIKNRLNEKNQLFIIKKGIQGIKGYVYVEAQPQHQEGAIEYIAVSNSNRKQGIGTLLVRFALNHLFSYEEIKEISLCVENKNESAINLYKSAGFKVKHDLISLEITTLDDNGVSYDSQT